MSKKKDTNNEVTILQDIIDGLNDKNKVLTDRVECLEEQLEIAYGVNAGLIDKQKDEEDYKNLTQLNTLLLVLMNIVIPHCDDSPLGQAVGKAIKKFNLTMAKSLVKDTIYIKEEDEEDWKDDDEEEYGEEEF